MRPRLSRWTRLQWPPMRTVAIRGALLLAAAAAMVPQFLVCVRGTP